MSDTRSALVSGVFYTAISKYSGIIVSLVVVGILSRLLTPDDFGVVAIATVIITFFAIFSDLGIAPAIIQNKDLSESDLDNIFSFTVWSGIVIAMLFFFSSWLIADYYNSPLLRILCQLLSLNLLFATLNVVPNALIYRAKRFRFVAVRTLSVQLICGVVSVVAALSGAGIYALLINPICSSILLFVINFRQYPRKLHLWFESDSIRKIFSFSLYQFLFNIINYFTRNLDKLLIGRYMNMAQLGYYEKSYRLMMLPLQNITHVISPVMHPIFADFQNDIKRLSESYIKVVRFLAFVGFPLSVFLFFAAREITLIVFGGQWEASVPVFRILALSVGVQIILSTSGSIFQAANSTKILFISGLLSSILNAIGIIVGIFVFRSLEAVAWGICLTFTINFVQCYLLLYCVTFRLSIWPFCRQLFSPILCTVITIVAMSLLNPLVNEFSLIWSLLAKGFVFVAIVVCYIQFTGEYDIKSRIIKLLKR